ncbi:hypothetical protein ACPCHT_22325 [Nucisporomicrobium flavum]|nr:hypothetical protein [Nucisporomicrobium flavum]
MESLIKKADGQVVGALDRTWMDVYVAGSCHLISETSDRDSRSVPA